MKHCPRCKSDSLEMQTIRYAQELDGEFYLIDNVPAAICAQCGEAILSESVAERIQQLIWSGATPERTEQVPVFEMA